MQLFNAWTWWKVAAATLALSVMIGCSGGAPTKPNAAPATTPPGSAPPSPVPTNNVVPVISGQPGTSLVVGQSYSFQPAATDANGDKLTFTVANLPRWASFSATTGRLTGIPAAVDVGSFGAIVITVSDGKATASLASFSLTVAAIGGGRATVSWQPPTLNDDGSALTDLAGYQVLYGRSTDDLSQVIAVQNPSVSSYVVDNLSPGSWYFAVVAVNASGASSQLSNIASKQIT